MHLFSGRGPDEGVVSVVGGNDEVNRPEMRIRGILRRGENFSKQVRFLLTVSDDMLYLLP